MALVQFSCSNTLSAQPGIFFFLWLVRLVTVTHCNSQRSKPHSACTFGSSWLNTSHKALPLHVLPFVSLAFISVRFLTCGDRFSPNVRLTKRESRESEKHMTHDSRRWMGKQQKGKMALSHLQASQGLKFGRCSGRAAFVPSIHPPTHQPLLTSVQGYSLE